jgi:SIR2-like domain
MPPMPPIPYLAIDEALKEGKAVPFLGAGVNFGHRPPGGKWKNKAPFLPSGAELSRYLATKSAFPLKEDHHRIDLPKVSSFYEVNVGRGSLREELREIFAPLPPVADYDTCSIHDYLASIPELRLVITTNYDNLAEKAFAAAQRAYYLVIHTVSQDNQTETNGGAGPNTSSSHNLQGQVLWWKYDPANPNAPFVPQREDPRDLAKFIDADTDTVIYKMHGTVSHHDKQWDNYVISEDDYMEFLSRMTNETALPNIVWESLHGRQFLFLGYGLGDWNLRVVLREIFRKTRFGHNKSWAIQFKPSELERQLWDQRGVKIYDIDINDFVKRLRQEQ